MAITTAPNLSSTSTETWSTKRERGPGLRREEGFSDPEPVSRDHTEYATQMGKGTQDQGNTAHRAQNGDFRGMHTSGGTLRKALLQGSGFTPHPNHTA